MTGLDLPLELSRVLIALGLSVFLGSFAAVRAAARAAASSAETAVAAAIQELLDKARFVAAGALLVGVLLEVQVSGSALAERRVARAALLFLLVATHVYTVMVVQPKMRYLDGKALEAPGESAAAPWRRKLDGATRKRDRVAAFGFGLALAALLAG